MARAVLKTCKASFNGVNEKGELPERLKLFNWGVNESNKGNFIVDELTETVFANNQRTSSRETVQIDFNHGTVPESEAFKAAGGSPEIGGYGRPIVIKGEGIFLEGVETTPSGVKKAGDYKDLSPSPFVDEETGRVIGIHSVALVPAGAVYDLTLKSAAENATAGLTMLSALLVSLSVPDSKICGPEDNKQPDAYTKSGALESYKPMQAEHFALLKKVMGMPEDMSYEDVMMKLKATSEGKLGDKGAGPITGANSKIMTWDAELDKANPGQKMLEAISPGIKELLAAELKPLAAELTLVKGQLDTERKAAQESQRQALIAQAGKDGKVIPLSADQIKTVDLSLLQSIITNLKPEVPLKAIVTPLSADQRPQVQKRTLNDAANAIARQIAPLRQMATATN